MEAVKGTSFGLEKGEIVSILGSNGAGKSSTLRAVTGLVKKEGKLSFGGRDISNLHAHKIPHLGMSMCPEGRGVFHDMTVEENLMLGGYTVRRDREKLKKGLGKAYSIFERLAERRSQLAGTLSGGEQQMLAIGRALMSEPGLLMLDEPSLGLSPKLVDLIFDSLKKINDDGAAILLVEQNAAMALEISSRVYVMQNGRIAASGTSKELDLETLKSKYFGGV